MSAVDPMQQSASTSSRALVGAELIWAVCSVILALAIIAIPVAGHVISPLFAIPLAMILAFSVANYAPMLSVVTILTALLFQNIFIAFISGGLSGPEEFKIIRGYNFVVLFTVWLTTLAGYYTRERGQNPSVDKIILMVLALNGLIFFYFLIGLVQNPTPAIIYLRNILSPLMVFQVTLLLSWKYETQYFTTLSVISGLVILLGYTELWFRDDWLQLTGSNTYWELDQRAERLSLAWDKQARETGLVTRGFLDTITVDFLNTPLLKDFKLTVARLLGPNLHAIAYAYALAFLFVAAAFRGSFLVMILLFPLMLFANAKGALILVILVTSAWTMFKLFGTRASFFMLGLILFAYAVVGVIVGLKIGDFHVLGFMGGLYDFLSFPVGHGIGVGGNLATDFSKLDWPAYQAAGRTPIALESAVGVLIYQMGPGAFVLLGFYGWVAWQTQRVASFTGRSIHAAAAFSLFTILVNGIFQEEALFSPLALSFFISLNGIILGQAIRKGFVV